MTQASAYNYWMSSTALYITLNAMGDPDKLQCYATPGAVIMCYIRGVTGLEYDSGHNYQRWPLKLYPTILKDTSMKYIYVAIPRPTSTSSDTENAIVVFPSEEIDLYGLNAAGDQVGSTNYYYIKTQGIINPSVDSEGNTQNRTWSHAINYGLLSTDEAYAAETDSWWEYDSVQDGIKFLKRIISATFLELTATTATITELFLGSDRFTGKAVYSSLTDDSEVTIVTPKYLLDREAGLESKYLRKDQDDTTTHKLTLANVDVKQMLQLYSSIQTNDYFKDMSTGKGWGVDVNGNGQFESLEIRSALSVRELVYNRLSAEESEYVFTESGTIESLTASDGSYVCKMKRRNDSDFHAFHVGDILKGVVNDLANLGGGQYYTAWMRVTDTDTTENTITVVSYADSQVPAGKNYAPTAQMVVQRYGNVVTPSSDAHADERYSSFIVQKADGSWVNVRQFCLYISSIEKRITMLDGVNQPIIDNSNYAAFFGLPYNMETDSNGNMVFAEHTLDSTQPYLYARAAFLQDIYRIDYKGQPIKEERFRGVWDPEVAALPSTDANYDPYIVTESSYDTVYYNNVKWQCAGTVGVAVTDEPSSTSTYWVQLQEALAGESPTEYECDMSISKAYYDSATEAFVTESVECQFYKVSGDNRTKISPENINIYPIKASGDYGDAEVWLYDDDEPATIVNGKITFIPDDLISTDSGEKVSDFSNIVLATRFSSSVQKDFYLDISDKDLKGPKGDSGESAVTYSIVPAYTYVKIGSDGTTYTPHTAITIKLYKTQGASVPTEVTMAYSATLKTYVVDSKYYLYYSLDGGTWTRLTQAQISFNNDTRGYNQAKSSIRIRLVNIISSAETADGMVHIAPMVSIPVISDAIAPQISDNGNWIINGEETSFKAIGDDGHAPKIRDGYWWEYDATASDRETDTNSEYYNYHNTGIKAEGSDGTDADRITISVACNDGTDAQTDKVYLKINDVAVTGNKYIYTYDSEEEDYDRSKSSSTDCAAEQGLNVYYIDKDTLKFIEMDVYDTYNADDVASLINYLTARAGIMKRFYPGVIMVMLACDRATCTSALRSWLYAHGGLESGTYTDVPRRHYFAVNLNDNIGYGQAYEEISETSTQETVTFGVNKGIGLILNGTSGTSPVSISNNNEGDQLPTDSDSKIVTSMSLSCSVCVKSGASVVETAQPTASSLKILNITPTITSSGGVHTIMWQFPMNLSVPNDRYTVDIPLVYNNVTYTSTFKVTKVKSGAPGVSPSTYNLRPSATGISFSRTADGKSLTPAQSIVLCGYVKNYVGQVTIYDGLSEAHLRNIDGLYTIYRRFMMQDGSYGAWKALADISGYQVVVNNTDAVNALEFCLSTAATAANVTDDNIYDIQTVTIKRDGTDGADSLMLTLSADRTIVTCDNNYNPQDDTPLTITAGLINISGTCQWSVKNNGTAISASYYTISGNVLSLQTSAIKAYSVLDVSVSLIYNSKTYSQSIKIGRVCNGAPGAAVNGKDAKPLRGPRKWTNGTEYQGGASTDAFQDIVYVEGKSEMYLCHWTHIANDGTDTSNPVNMPSDSTTNPTTWSASVPWSGTDWLDITATAVMFATRGKIQNADLTDVTIQGTITEVTDEWEPKSTESNIDTAFIIKPGDSGTLKSLSVLNGTLYSDDDNNRLVMLPTYEEIDMGCDYKTGSYQRTGTKLSIYTTPMEEMMGWDTMDDAVGYTESLAATLSNCVLVCADPQVFLSKSSDDYHYPNGSYIYQKEIPSGKVDSKGTQIYKTNTYQNGRFNFNGRTARFVLLFPGQHLDLVSQVQKIKQHDNGSDNYTEVSCLVWTILNTSDFEASDVYVDDNKLQYRRSYMWDNGGEDAFVANKFAYTRVSEETGQSVNSPIYFYLDPAHYDGNNTPVPPSWSIVCKDV